MGSMGESHGGTRREILGGYGRTQGKHKGDIRNTRRIQDTQHTRTPNTIHTHININTNTNTNTHTHEYKEHKNKDTQHTRNATHTEHNTPHINI